MALVDCGEISLGFMLEGRVGYLTSVKGVAENWKKVMVRSRACHTESPKYLMRAESGKVTFTMRSVSLRYSPGGNEFSWNGMDTSFRPVNFTSFADTGAVVGEERREEEVELRWGAGVEEIVNPCSAEFGNASLALSEDFVLAGKEWL